MSSSATAARARTAFLTLAVESSVPSGCKHLTLVDFSTGMLAEARAKAEASDVGPPVECREMDARKLAFDDARFRIPAAALEDADAALPANRAPPARPPVALAILEPAEPAGARRRGRLRRR